MHRRFLATLLGSAMFAASPAAAYEDWSQLVQGAPPGANAIGLIDVGFLRQQAEQSPETREVMHAIKGVMSDKTVKSAFVAEMGLRSMEPKWEAGVVVISDFMSPERLAKLANGTIEEIEGRKVVWSPRDVFLSTIGNDKVVAYRPADRRALAKFLRDKKESALPPMSPYLASIVKKGTNKTPVILGLDLKDSVSSAALKPQLKTLTSLAGKGDVDQIADLLVDIEGVTFTVEAEHAGKCMLRVDFSRPPQALSDVGKDFVIEIMELGGAAIPEMKDWKAYVQGNSLTMLGSVNKYSMSNVLSLFNTPFAIRSVQTAAETYPEGQSLTQSQQQLLASKGYFNQVNKIVENVRGYKAQTLGQRALWCDRQGRKIDHLPILNVDPELLDWGSSVSSLLRGSGLEMRNVNMKAATMKDNTVGTTGGGTWSGYGWGGYGWGLPSAGYTAGQAARDSANATLKSQQNLAAQGAYLEAMGQIDKMTPVIRRKMTDKYQTEF